jgi:putative endonuclease
MMEGFTKKYEIKTLVYFEAHETAESAIAGKNKSRNGRGRKVNLITKDSPEWKDLWGLIVS